MPRNAWTVAGEELQGFNNYLNQQGREDARARQYQDMVELRRQNLLRQMQQDQYRVEQDRLAQQNREQLLDMRKEESEWKKQERERKRDMDAREQERKRQRQENLRNFGQAVQQHNMNQGQEGWQPMNKQQLASLAFQNQLAPEDFNTYLRILSPSQRAGGFNEEEYRRKKQIDAEFAKPTTPTPLKEERVASKFNQNQVVDEQANEAYQQYLVEGLGPQSIIDDKADPKYRTMNSRWATTTKLLDNIRRYNNNVVLAKEATIDEEVDRLVKERGYDPKNIPQSVFFEASRNVHNAMRNPAQ